MSQVLTGLELEQAEHWHIILYFREGLGIKWHQLEIKSILFLPTRNNMVDSEVKYLSIPVGLVAL